MGSVSEKGQPVIPRQQSPGMRAAKFIFHSGVAAYMITAYRALSAITERVVTEEVSSSSAPGIIADNRPAATSSS